MKVYSKVGVFLGGVLINTGLQNIGAYEGSPKP